MNICVIDTDSWRRDSLEEIVQGLGHEIKRFDLNSGIAPTETELIFEHYSVFEGLVRGGLKKPTVFYGAEEPDEVINCKHYFQLPNGERWSPKPDWKEALTELVKTCF
jgi:hypothetical protein